MGDELSRKAARKAQAREQQSPQIKNQTQRDYDADGERLLSRGGENRGMDDTKAKIWRAAAYLRIRRGGSP